MEPSAAIGADEESLWTAFAGSCPEATLFHLPVWSGLLADTYGYRRLLLTQKDRDGAITAGIPVVEVRRSLRRRRFAALPFTDYCPPLGRDAASLARFSDGLVQWWDAAARPRLEIRGPLTPAGTFAQRAIAVRHTLALEGDSERVLQRTRRDTRASIQRARRDGVEVRLTRSAGDLDAFYRLHVDTRRRLGVPVQPKRFLEALWARVIEPGFGFAVMASARGRSISGAIFLAWNGHLIYKYSASDSAYWKLRPNKLVVWTAIEWACRQGYRDVDFGRSDFDDAGLRDFKASFGSREQALSYAGLSGVPAPLRRGVAARTMARLIRASPPAVCRAVGELLYGHAA